MTYYLLVFDRRRGQLVEDVQPFSDASEAMSARFHREAVLTSPDIEVVVLGAASREALENTHSRYFGSPHELQEV
jgi:hypothetical protein